VDDAHYAVLIPLGGVPTPFHIATIKNVSVTKAEDSPYTQLRINFLPPPPDTPAAYLREITMRAQDATNINKVHRQIKDLRKRFTDAEKRGTWWW
jgi:nucleosome binding factor SPN SPT16 subunit